jgi:hypothetical protein
VKIDTDEDKAHYLREDGKTWLRWWSGTTAEDEAIDLDVADDLLRSGTECDICPTMREGVAKYKINKYFNAYMEELLAPLNKQYKVDIQCRRDCFNGQPDPGKQLCNCLEDGCVAKWMRLR